ncbi:hypothetical protein BAC1_02401 [uncultured bacterium]|nr:hypothetical protein BAC1_02401 [uncultured bacterium]
MNDGETAGVLKAIDKITSTGAARLVPGHGPIASKEDALKYKGYIEALRAEVKRMMEEGMGRNEAASKVSLPAYSSWLMYREWLPANAARVYDELSAERDEKD